MRTMELEAFADALDALVAAGAATYGESARPSKRCVASTRVSSPSSPRRRPPSRHQRSGRPTVPRRPRRGSLPNAVSRGRRPSAGCASGAPCASCPSAPGPGERAPSGLTRPRPSPRPDDTAPRPPWPGTRRCWSPRPLGARLRGPRPGSVLLEAARRPRRGRRQAERARGRRDVFLETSYSGMCLGGMTSTPWRARSWPPS